MTTQPTEQQQAYQQPPAPAPAKPGFELPFSLPFGLEEKGGLPSLLAGLGLLVLTLILLMVTGYIYIWPLIAGVVLTLGGVALIVMKKIKG